MFFACADNTGVTDAIVVSAHSSKVKVDCFHTLEPPLISVDSKGFKCYPYSYHHADLAAFEGMAASTWPILVNFLRFTAGQQMAEFIGDSNDSRHMRREASRGLFETLVKVCRADYQRVIEHLKKIIVDLPTRSLRIAGVGE